MALRYGVYISEKISSCVIDVGVFLHQAVLLAALPNRPAKCGKLVDISHFSMSVGLSVSLYVTVSLSWKEPPSACLFGSPFLSRCSRLCASTTLYVSLCLYVCSCMPLLQVYESLCCLRIHNRTLPFVFVCSPVSIFVRNAISMLNGIRV